MRRHLQLLLLAVLLLGLSLGQEEKRLTVYSAQASFTIPVTDHDGDEYVSLTDLVDPFGNATLTHKGNRWKLKLAATAGGTLEAEFNDGSDTAKVRGKKIQLTHAFWSDGQRGYVSVGSAPLIMLQVTHQSTLLRANSRRLFVGDLSTTYSEEMAKSSPNKLVLHFSAPVNPGVSTEPGRVRLTFQNEPVLPSGANPQNFDSATIRSSTFTEDNGAAQLTIATTAPTQAAFSDGGKTITLTATPPPLQTAQAAKPANPTPTTTQPQVNAAAQPGQVAQPSAPPRMLVIIDPAHGGDDPGATLGNGLLEKDVTLAIARRVRAELDQRGIASLLLRDGDANPSLDQRALDANTSHAALYICIHATSFGTGVNLYSARFGPDVKVPAHGFLPWDTAQAAYLQQSHNLEASVVSELESRQVHSLPLESGLRPLRNIAKPAIVIEVAEPASTPEPMENGLTSIAYQQEIASAIANGVANLKGALEVHR